MNIAVLGASGMLGSMLVDHLRQYHQITATVRDLNLMAQRENVEYRQFDVLNFRGIELANILRGNDWVINAIGAIPQRMYPVRDYIKINAVFPIDLSYYDYPIIQIATDCVYSGRRGLYTEADECDVTEGYGYSKHLGEIYRDGFYNIRCSIIGLETIGEYSLLKWFLSQPKDAVLSGYTNHLWNGVTTLAFARICRGIIENELQMPNFQHLVPADAVSKYELLRRFGECFDREDIKVEPVEHKNKVDRRLATINPDLNETLWSVARYQEAPLIENMVKELAEFVKQKEGALSKY